MTDAHPSNGKWVSGLPAEMTVGKAARRILGVRLAAVREAVPPVTNWGPDAEPVHHLRVAARRAGAALKAFGDLLPKKARRKSRNALKRLRRAAGEARNADVFLDGIRTWSVHQSPADRPGLQFLLGHAFAAREAAQERLTAALKNWESKAADKVFALPDLCRSGDKETLGERAVPTLTQLIEKLESATQENLDDYKQLHGVRIRAKRLRYALELFVDCYPPAVREQVYPRVEAVQDILGNLNDSHQAVALLDGLLSAVRQTQPALWDTLRSGMEGVRAYHVQREREQRTAFWDAWRAWRSVLPEALLSNLTPFDPDQP